MAHAWVSYNQAVDSHYHGYRVKNPFKSGASPRSESHTVVNQGLEHGNTLGTSIVLTDLLKAELSRLLPKFVNIETTEPEVAGKIPSVRGGWD